MKTGEIRSFVSVVKNVTVVMFGVRRPRCPRRGGGGVPLFAQTVAASI